MFNYHIKSILSRLINNYRLTVLTLIGLAIGIGSSFVIFTKVRYEKSFDNFHSNTENIYRVVRFTSGLKYLNGALEYRAGIQFPIPRDIRKTIPEATSVSSLLYIYGNKISASGNSAQKPTTFLLKEGIVFADPQFFDVFDYARQPINWISGDKSNALKSVYSVVITHKIEELLFADNSALGRVINIGGKDYTVNGVIEKFPVNSDFPFQIMISLSTFTEVFYKGALSDWGSISDNFQCFVKVKKGTDINAINQKLNKILQDNLPKQEASIRSMKLQPLKEIHRDERFGNFNHHTISNLILNALSLIGILILLIVGLNFSSMLIADSIKHNKEISIRRIMGIRKLKIFENFFLHALTLTALASIVGFFFAFIVLKTQGDLIAVPQFYYEQISFRPIVTFLFIIVSISLIASVLPGFFFTSKPALAVLKQSESGILINKNNINKVTIIFQFTAVLVLLISTAVVLKQLVFINNKDLGFNPHGIITTWLPDNSSSKLGSLSARLKDCPDVAGVSFCSGNPTEAHSWSEVVLKYNGTQFRFDSEIKSVDTSYLSLNGFHWFAGNNFSKLDTAFYVVVNNEFMTEAGIKDPNQILGLRIEGQNAVIIGVVNDAHSGSLHQKLRPCLYTPMSTQFREIEIKLNPVIEKNKRSEQLAKIRGIWKEFFPGENADFGYMTDQIDGFYKAEKDLFSLLLLFTIITTLLCCLGVFGLSIFIGEQRLKEIGIRKVNGARTSQILILLNSNYIRWIALAMILACPIAHYAMSKWLQNFAYKTELSWWVFALAGIVAVAVAVLTVSWQSWRAATRNPVESLRYE